MRSALGEDLAEERSRAVRSLLATPLLDAERDREAFATIARHADWLVEYFEKTCGWTLTVDATAGFARLAKRAVEIDPTRPLRRLRGDHSPFDPRRYQLLCLACAELVRHPVTTVGLLAGSIAAEAGLDTSRYAERSAFVDAVGILVSWGTVRVTSGEVDAFVENAAANAILTADTARLHRLLVSPTAPSALPDGSSTETAIDRLAHEPRYGSAADPGESTSDEVRLRLIRHRLGRRLLDDPATYLDDLSAAERDYATNPTGRRWLRDRAGDAGLRLEERSEGMVAVDPDALATDIRFPAPQGNAHQLALLLADLLVPAAPDGRRVARLEPEDLRDAVHRIMTRHPGWARGHREGDGPLRIAEQAVELLAAHGLVRRDPDGSVVALPALARYRVAEPVVRGGSTLFEEDTHD